MPRFSSSQVHKLIVAGAAVVMLTAVLGLGGVLADEIVATVNGEEITEAELIAELEQRYGYPVRESLIEKLIVEQGAANKNLTCTEDEIDEAFEKAQEQINERARQTRESFEMWLVRQHLTRAALRDRLRMQILLEKMVKPEVVVTEEDVNKWYEQNAAQLEQSEAMKVSFIVFKTQEEAESAKGQIAADEITWEEAAKQYNLDPYGRENGGLLGYVPRGEKKFQQVAFELHEDGDISEPFQDEMGWHLIRREEYRPSGIPRFEEVEDDIRQMLTASRLATAAQTRLQSLTDLADIKRFGEFTQPGQ